MRKIINITIFAIAGLAVILAVLFGFGFNQETKDKFKNIVEIRTSNPQMLIDLENATIETLPDFIAKYQEVLNARNAELKKEKLQRDIFYTFIFHLGNIINQETFDNFKAKFPEYSRSMFALADDPQYFINGFNNVNSFADFQRYFDNLNADYQIVSQNYLRGINAVKAETTLLKQVTDINAVISTTKKEYDLKELQKNIRTFKSEARSFNTTLILSYILFFATCAVMLVFLLWNTFANMKSNVGLLIGIGALILLVIIGYATASSELSPVMIKEGADAGTVRWVGAGLFVGYSMLFGTIAIIVGTMIFNAIKKK
ncbi:MAG: hypothetical protein FWC34_08875 [Bacteroidetes bacterium]|nr:hypothetical protein [Bacteroidota bacterium]MCL2303472.1 hypothetical protein [Lentimicrobiaceae bacterium]